MDLLAVGTLAIDSVATVSESRDNLLGGSASFLATAASYFCPVGMAGVVGEDFPKEYLDFFRSRNIDTTGVVELPGKTFRWSGRYERNVDLRTTLATELNVLADFKPDLPRALRDASLVVLGNMDPDIQSQVLRQMSQPKLVACDTMNYWIERTNPQLRQTLRQVDLLSINDSEAEELSGENSLVLAARTIHAMGPKILVIKRGEHGAILSYDDDLFVAPAYPLSQVRDPTGAGDTFAGGMMGYLAHCGRWDRTTLRQAVIVASAMASFSVEDFSLDRLRSLSLEEVRQRFGALKKLTEFDDKNVVWPQA